MSALEGLSDLLAESAGPRRQPVSMRTVRVVESSPLVLDDSGTVLDGAIRPLSSYSPAAGDLAVMIRAGGLAILIGKVVS